MQRRPRFFCSAPSGSRRFRRRVSRAECRRPRPTYLSLEILVGGPSRPEGIPARPSDRQKPMYADRQKPDWGRGELSDAPLSPVPPRNPSSINLAFRPATVRVTVDKIFACYNMIKCSRRVIVRKRVTVATAVFVIRIDLSSRIRIRFAYAMLKSCDDGVISTK